MKALILKRQIQVYINSSKETFNCEFWNHDQDIRCLVFSPGEEFLVTSFSAPVNDGRVNISKTADIITEFLYERLKK